MPPRAKGKVLDLSEFVTDSLTDLNVEHPADHRFQRSRGSYQPRQERESDAADVSSNWRRGPPAAEFSRAQLSRGGVPRGPRYQAAPEEDSAVWRSAAPAAKPKFSLGGLKKLMQETDTTNAEKAKIGDTEDELPKSEPRSEEPPKKEEAPKKEEVSRREIGLDDDAPRGGNLRRAQESRGFGDRRGPGESRYGAGESRYGAGESRYGAGESRYGAGESRYGAGESRYGGSRTESRGYGGDSRPRRNLLEEVPGSTEPTEAARREIDTKKVDEEEFLQANPAPFKPVSMSRTEASQKRFDSLFQTKSATPAVTKPQPAAVVEEEEKQPRRKKNDMKAAYQQARQRQKVTGPHRSDVCCRNNLKGCTQDIDTVCTMLEPLIASDSKISVEMATQELEKISKAARTPALWESTLLLACIHVQIIREIAAVAEDIMELENFQDYEPKQIEALVESKLVTEARTCVANATPLVEAYRLKAQGFLGDDFDYVNMQELTRSIAKCGAPRLSQSLTLCEILLLAWLDTGIIGGETVLAWYDDPEDETEGRMTVLTQIGPLVQWLKGSVEAEGLDDESNESEED